MKQESATTAIMTRIHIREATNPTVAAIAAEDQQQRDGSKSPSPARRAVEKKEPGGVDGNVGGETTAKRPGVSDESGYYEEEEPVAASIQAEDSVEIIFDKNASNNNLGADGRSPNTGTVNNTV